MLLRSGVFAFSIPKEGRQNADVCGFESRPSSGGEQLLLVVADGVSSSAHGAGSAAAALSEAAASFREGRHQNRTPAGELSCLLVEINRHVAARFGGAGLCSFVGALWDAGTDRVTIGNVGDSPAFFWDYRHLLRLGHVDHTTPAVRSNAAAGLGDGLPVMQSFLSQAMGQVADVNPHIVEYGVPASGGILCVASDGVLEQRLEQFLAEFGSRLSNPTVEKFCREVRVISRDDTTLAAVRLGLPYRTEAELGFEDYESQSSSERARLLASAGQSAYLPATTLAAAFWMETDECRARDILALMERHGSDWSATEWTVFLDRCATERRPLLLFASRAASNWINRPATKLDLPDY